MEGGKLNNSWLIGFSFLVALVLMVYPLPLDWRWLRPELMCLLVIYWVLRFPQLLGVGMAFVLGLVQDVVQGSLLGQHALALVVTIYITQLSIHRLRTYGTIQQMMWIFALVAVHELFLYWVSMLLGREALFAYFWAPALISAFIWPLLSHGLDRLCWVMRLGV
ncbi:MAG: rod shape-determining protein MreD [Cellvibrionaceae bacterium]|nr:rod shape-determining protein MreD [Cellvibrionaceae bacterium]